MSQLESMELAVKQEKDAIHSLRMKHSSIEGMLKRKIKKNQDKIKDFEAQKQANTSIRGKSTPDDTLMRLKAKMIGKKVEREELQEKVNYLENQIVEEKKSIDLAQKELIALKEAAISNDSQDKDTSTSAEENLKILENQLESVEQDLAKERSLLEELAKTKIELETMVSENMQFLVNFTTEIKD